MKKTFVILCVDRYDYSHRYWVMRDTLEQAEDVAKEYEKKSFTIEIYEINKELYH